ncbi:hypothetical protein ACWEO2_42280 [Nocardia sp. NPDC004278]
MENLDARFACIAHPSILALLAAVAMATLIAPLLSKNTIYTRTMFEATPISNARTEHPALPIAIVAYCH